MRPRARMCLRAAASVASGGPAGLGRLAPRAMVARGMLI